MTLQCRIHVCTELYCSSASSWSVSAQYVVSTSDDDDDGRQAIDDYDL